MTHTVNFIAHSMLVWCAEAATLHLKCVRLLLASLYAGGHMEQRPFGLHGAAVNASRPTDLAA